MAIRSENPAHHPAGWTVKKGRWFLEGASTECLRLGLGWRPTPNEKLFIFDIQNAMAGLFFFHHHLRGEKGGEERRRGGIAAIDVPRFQVHIPSLVPPSITLSLSLAALPSIRTIRRPFKSGSSCDSLSLLRLGKRFDPLSHSNRAPALLAASADSNFIKMFYLSKTG